MLPLTLSLLAGLIFTYLDQQTVWDSFCGTYEAIYDLMGQFDSWYDLNRNGAIQISLQSEWKTYIRTALDSVVLRGREMFDWMNHNKQ